jgi:hypothetical protein
MINKLGGTRHAFRTNPSKSSRVIRIDPSTRWNAIWTFQFMFIFSTCNSDAPGRIGLKV